jgi:hypothetical protein
MIRRRRARRRLASLAALLFLIAAGSVAETGGTLARVPLPAPPQEAGFRQPVPDRIDPAARFLIYLHGRIIEERGIHPTDPRFGPYEYVAIVRALEKKGFVVISEARPKGTDPEQYARIVQGQAASLLADGVPPQNITVVGASKGAVIAMLASTLLRNRDMNFVLMSNCNDWVREHYEIDLYGNVLSLYDVKDAFGGTCGPIFSQSKGLNRRREVELKLGIGHALLYRPMKEWIDPVDEWAAESRRGALPAP